MEAHLVFSKRFRILASVFTLPFFFSLACGTAKKSTDTPEGDGNSPVVEPYGPTLPPGNPTSGEGSPPAPEKQLVYGPEKIQVRPLILVLGPGMARGFAHVGVIRALHEARFPIGGIIGTEMGALIGALYALEGNINHLEWGLTRFFKEEVFKTKSGLLPKFFDRERRAAKIEADLKQVFGEKDLRSAKIPLWILLKTKSSSSPAMVSDGPLRVLVRGALGGGALYEPVSWNGTQIESVAAERSFPLEEIRSFTAGAIVSVDVSGLSQESAANMAAGADVLIQPDLSGIGLEDFHRKTEAAFRGKKAVLEKLSELRQWTGLPRNETEGVGSGQ